MHGQGRRRELSRLAVPRWSIGAAVQRAAPGLLRVPDGKPGGPEAGSAASPLFNGRDRLSGLPGPVDGTPCPFATRKGGGGGAGRDRAADGGRPGRRARGRSLPNPRGQRAAGIDPAPPPFLRRTPPPTFRRLPRGRRPWGSGAPARRLTAHYTHADRTMHSTMPFFLPAPPPSSSPGLFFSSLRARALNSWHFFFPSFSLPPPPP